MESYIFVTQNNKTMKTEKLLSYVSVLACLAALAPITGDDNWLSFLSFLSFLAFTRAKTDERLKNNLNRAARNGFIVSMLYWVAFALVLSNKPDFDTLLNMLEVALFAITISFVISFTLYDKKGI